MLFFAGLLLSSLALHMAAPAQRLVSEPLTFAATLLSTAVQLPATAVDCRQQWLLPSGGWASLPDSTLPLHLAEVLQASPNDAMFEADSFRGSLLLAALGVVGRASDVFSHLVSYPELFVPAQEALSVLINTQGLPQVTHHMTGSLLHCQCIDVLLFSEGCIRAAQCLQCLMPALCLCTSLPCSTAL